MAPFVYPDDLQLPATNPRYGRKGTKLTPTLWTIKIKQTKVHRMFSRSYIWMSMYLGCNLPRYPTCGSSSNVLVGYWSQVIKKDAVMTGSKFESSVLDLVLDND